ncbi:MAG: bifunctional DNA-binding transcriptional regulator/O6-methylguanine-DNA methyltransferase Ada [Burkholderiales bacterium]|nr:bifunctional DNA-binding transcriptional regulator/O6-methylguanine-DNA methyltransferase Ada [Burkholderiales bacterium]
MRAHDAQWRAVLARDPSADGRFVFAVRTTGVYCRPSCPARRARRENVAFFPSGEAARAAGFRACKRCRPDAARADAVLVAAVRAACERIDREGDVPLARLAGAAGYGASHFQKAFKRIVGVSPKQYAIERRLARAERHIEKGRTVTDAILEAGFGSASRFYASRRGRAIAPARAMRGGAGLAIRFTTLPTALGPMLVAATDRGICAIEFGESEAALSQLARQRYARADLRPADAALSRWARSIAALAARPGPARGLPLDVQGTSFQRRVWKALQSLPPGTTTTYAALAARIGRPGAARAVARACASNPAALVIPCHRVVAKDGALAGYRWGIERKAELLARESRAAGGRRVGARR